VYKRQGSNSYEGGNLIVTAVGNDSATCTIRNASGIGADFTAKVACYGMGDSSGFDSRFSLMLNWPRDSSTGVNGYARTNNFEGNGSYYTPNATQAWSSSPLGQDAKWIGKVLDTLFNGTKKTIRQGIYIHRFYGFSQPIFPAVLFSTWESLDADSNYQKNGPGKRLVYENMVNDNGNLTMVVNTYSRFGILNTAKFYIYAAYPETGRKGGYAFITGLSNPTVDSRQAWNSAGPSPTVTRSSVGQYRVQFPGLTNSTSYKGNAQVSTAGLAGSHCKITDHDFNSDSSGAGVSVSCWDKNGLLSDNQFLVYFID
jgi:hypothetical protein